MEDIAEHRAPPLLMRTVPKYNLAGTEDVHYGEFGALKFFSVTDLPILYRAD